MFNKNEECYLQDQLKRDNGYLQADNQALKNHLDQVSQQLKESLQVNIELSKGENKKIDDMKKVKII